MKNRILAILVALLLLLSLTACGGETGSSGEGSTTSDATGGARTEGSKTPDVSEPALALPEYTSEYAYTASGVCGDGVWWGYDEENTTLVIGGSGAMEDYANLGDTPWDAYRKDLRTVVIQDGVIRIGEKAFQDHGMENILIPDSVTSIGADAFFWCARLGSVTLPKGLTEIEKNVFAASGIWSIVIPDGVTRIGRDAFDNALNLTEVTIPDTVTSIESGAFGNCSHLTGIVIPDGVTEIAANTFWGCKSMKSITIPASVTSISNQAFYQCDSLTDIYYTGTQEQWTAIKVMGNPAVLETATIHYDSAG